MLSGKPKINEYKYIYVYICIYIWDNCVKQKIFVATPL